MSRSVEILSVLLWGAVVGFAVVFVVVNYPGQYCDITQPSMSRMLVASATFGISGGLVAAVAYAYLAGLFDRDEA